LRKFADGRPLAEMEQAELAHLLPAEVLSDPPPLRVEYLREAPEYAAAIGVHKRSVYRWIDAGIEARDPCPLDQPGEILAWWARLMSKSAPEYLVKWAANQSAPGAGEGSRPADGKPAAKKEDADDTRQPERQAIDITRLSGMGLEASVQLLRQTVEANAKLLAAALNDPNDDALAHYQPRYEKSVEQLRKAETALFQFQKLRGDLAPRSEFRADLVAIMTGLRGMMRRRANNVAAAARLALVQLKLPDATIATVLGVVQTAVEVEGRREEAQLRSAKNWKILPSGEVVTDPEPPPAPPTAAPIAAPTPAAAPELAPVLA
jgi:hypothetical protein